MILQNLVFPKEGITNEIELYFHVEKGEVKEGEKGLFLSKGSIVNTLTYFNSFSVDKWKYYTTLSTLSLSFMGSGSCLVQLCQANLVEDEIKKEQLKEVTLQQGQLSMEVPMEQMKGIAYLRIEALEDMELYQGNWETEDGANSPVHIAIGICTFRREEYVKKTIRTIETLVKEKDLQKAVSLYVSDNGNTLPKEELCSEITKVVYNKNAGGSGGFGRCMLEALSDRKEKGYSHMLLMDDDIVLEPEAIYRTYTFLSFLKEEYKDHILGGGLLRLDFPYIQHANGETWDGGKIGFTKRGYDLRKEKDVLRNEEIVPVEYNGWWYCCIPMEDNFHENLPLPIFIHADDIEYSLRYHGKIITLNGIGVWHDAFDNRRASSMEYYDMRNLLVCNAIHHPEYTLKRIQNTVCRHLIGQMLHYRYEDQFLTIKAVEDFCKGPSFLKEQDPEALNGQIMSMGYKQEDVAKQLEECQVDKYYQVPTAEELYPSEGFGKREIFTLNGWLLPGKRTLVPIPFGAHPSRIGRYKKVLLFDPDSKKGFVVQKKYRWLWRTIRHCMQVKKMLKNYYAQAAETYRQEYKELTSESFWRTYLQKGEVHS